MSLYEHVTTADTGRRSADVHPLLASAARDSSVDYAVKRPAARWAKRSLDLVIGIPLLLLLLVVGPILAVVVAVTSPGPVLFRQLRTGRGGRQFHMFKLRTMYADAEDRLERDPELMALYLENDYKIPAELDPRITPVGRVLRKLSLDELPQILNVVLGQMSLVGPRPIVAQQVIDLYGDDMDAYLATRPGLTGRWQVSGRSEVTRANRAELDRAYAEDWSLLGDLVILLRTFPTVLSARGAH